MCVSTCTQKAPNLRCFLKGRLTNTPTPPPCRWPSLITSRTFAKFQLVWHRLCDVVLFRSSCLFEHTRTAVLCTARVLVWPSIFLSKILKASPVDIRKFCASACTQKAPNLRCFLKRRLPNTPRCHHLADGQRSSLYPPSPYFILFDPASEMCCSPPASSSTPSRPSVYYYPINISLS